MPCSDHIKTSFWYTEKREAVDDDISGVNHEGSGLIYPGDVLTI